MSLPPSFIRTGFLAPQDAIQIIKTRDVGGNNITSRSKYRRLMCGTEGDTDTGKTEFGLSAPKCAVVALDRSFDAVVENPNPPMSRRKDYGIAVVQAPMATQSTKQVYAQYWAAYYTTLMSAADNVDVRSIFIDGDSDSWELQQLAEWGVLTGVPGPPGLAYSGVNAARRALTARLWDSGKIVIASNKLKDEYLDAVDPVTGKPILTKEGKTQTYRSGQRERRGFSDQDYLWQIQLRHLYKPARVGANGKEIPKSWGLRILKCKINKDLETAELWGDDCNLLGLVTLVFPNTPPSAWGF